jgi:hypothetical protein
MCFAWHKLEKQIRRLKFVARAQLEWKNFARALVKVGKNGEPPLAVLLQIWDEARTRFLENRHASINPRVKIALFR